MSEPEKRLTPSMGDKARRIFLLRSVADAIGQAKLARAIGIQERSLRAKLAADRDITDADLRVAATALEARSLGQIAHVDLIRSAIA